MPIEGILALPKITRCIVIICHNIQEHCTFILTFNNIIICDCFKQVKKDKGGHKIYQTMQGSISDDAIFENPL